MLFYVKCAIIYHSEIFTVGIGTFYLKKEVQKMYNQRGFPPKLVGKREGRNLYSLLILDGFEVRIMTSGDTNFSNLRINSNCILKILKNGLEPSIIVLPIAQGISGILSTEEYKIVTKVIANTAGTKWIVSCKYDKPLPSKGIQQNSNHLSCYFDYNWNIDFYRDYIRRFGYKSNFFIQKDGLSAKIISDTISLSEFEADMIFRILCEELTKGSSINNTYVSMRIVEEVHFPLSVERQIDRADSSCNSTRDIWLINVEK